MSSLKEMRDELRDLRKSHPEHKPVSKMRKADISSMIQKLKVHREDTPQVALFSSAPAKTYKSATESVKKAKESEFPLKIHAEAPPTTKAPKMKKATAPPKAKAEKGAMVTEKGAVEVKKGRGKKME